MRKSHSPHTQFFTSLKHLEKRLKLENHPAGPSTVPQPPPPPPSPPPIEPTQQSDSYGTPLYLNYNQSPTTNTNLQESEAPQQFLSRSPDFPLTHQNSNHESQAEGTETPEQRERFDLDDDIKMLMEALGLSDSEEIKGNDLGCDDDGFYDKIVGIVGPKNVNEVKRLELWIEHLLKGEMKEPFRLAHLLLGKAAFMNSGDGFVFPCTIDEFLQNEPPID